MESEKHASSRSILASFYPNANSKPFINKLINEPEPLLYAKFYGIDSSKYRNWYSIVYNVKESELKREFSLFSIFLWPILIKLLF